jgi:uncharacterized membrane protein YbaN (DUF454 family)
MKKHIFAALGIICIVLGSIGIVTPVLPTTPFMLLAAYLFARSSPKMYKFLLENKVFGKYISDYINNKPIPIKTKVFSIFFVWFGLSCTFYFADLPTWVIVLLVFIGVAVSTHIALLGKFNLMKRKTP